MMLRIFSVFDSKARVYLQPFYAINMEVAQRHFSRGVRDPSLDMGAFPEDFTLFEVGSWNDQTGVITSLSPANNLGNGAAYKEAPI